MHICQLDLLLFFGRDGNASMDQLEKDDVQDFSTRYVFIKLGWQDAHWGELQKDKNNG